MYQCKYLHFSDQSVTVTLFLELKNFSKIKKNNNNDTNNNKINTVQLKSMKNIFNIEIKNLKSSKTLMVSFF